MKLKTVCVTCHEDIHQGQFVEKSGIVICEKCHGFTDWFAEKFDHNRDSKFRVDGAHAAVKCEGCHKKEKKSGKEFVRYKPLATACSNCHKGSEILKGAQKI